MRPSPRPRASGRSSRPLSWSKARRPSLPAEASARSQLLPSFISSTSIAPTRCTRATTACYGGRPRRPGGPASHSTPGTLRCSTRCLPSAPRGSCGSPGRRCCSRPAAGHMPCCTTRPRATTRAAGRGAGPTRPLSRSTSRSTVPRARPPQTSLAQPPSRPSTPGRSQSRAIRDPTGSGETTCPPAHSSLASRSAPTSAAGASAGRIRSGSAGSSRAASTPSAGRWST
mmetsp:Transcript_15196/g.49576  ORF Transcript_15196/g.49576 Transcript_15196/m.49576 type:complete len:228 (-) Transcript_15196:223-906(-)